MIGLGPPPIDEREREEGDDWFLEIIGLGALFLNSRVLIKE